ncbi:MAG: hypothetical protein ACI90V_008078 [Bacillariaceae sp.]|jgi:hypothetical protein
MYTALKLLGCKQCAALVHRQNSWALMCMLYVYNIIGRIIYILAFNDNCDAPHKELDKEFVSMH